MSDKVDLDTEEFDFDNLDAMDFDFDGEEPSAERSAIDDIKNNAINSVLSQSSLRTAGKVVKENLLAPGYSVAIEGVDSALNAVDELYEEAKKRLKPAENSLKQILRSQQERLDSILPESLAKRVKEYANEREEGSKVVDPTDAAVENALNAVFGTQAKAAVHVSNEAGVEASDDVHFKASMAEMSQISKNVARLVGYQDNILANYHRKSLEIQIRQFYLSKDLLTIAKASAVDNKQFLQGILKNTSLPDIAKLRVTENYGQMIENELLGGLSTKASGKIKDVGSEFVKRSKEKVANLLDNITMAVEQAGDAAEMLGDLDTTTRNQLLGETIGEKSVQLIATLVGKNLKGRYGKFGGQTAEEAEYFTRNFTNILQQYARGERDKLPISDDALDKIPGVNRLIRLMKNRDIYDEEDNLLFTAKDLRAGRVKDSTGRVFKSLEEIRREAVGDLQVEDEFGLDNTVSADKIGRLKEKVTDEGSSGGLADILSDLIPTENKDFRITSRLSETATKTSIFDNITRRSIIEIIPGYLSRILQQVTELNTGEPADRIVYSSDKEAFVTLASEKERIKGHVFDEATIASRKERMASLVDLMGGDKLSPEARNILIEQMLIDRDTQPNPFFDPAMYANKRHYRTENEKAVEELVKFFENNRYVESNKNAIDKQYLSIRGLGDSLENKTKQMLATGDSDILRELNILRTDTDFAEINNDYVDSVLAGRGVEVGATTVDSRLKEEFDRRAETGAGSIKEAVDEAKKKAKETVDQVKNTVKEKVGEIKETEAYKEAEKKVKKAKDTTKKEAERVKKYAQEATPESVKNDLKQVSDKAKDLVKEEVGKLKETEAYKEAVEEIKSTTKDKTEEIKKTKAYQETKAKINQLKETETYKKAEEKTSRAKKYIQEATPESVKEDLIKASEQVGETVEEVKNYVENATIDSVKNDLLKTSEQVKGAIKDKAEEIKKTEAYKKADKFVKDKIEDLKKTKAYQEVKKTTESAKNYVENATVDSVKKDVRDKAEAIRKGLFTSTEASVEETASPKQEKETLSEAIETIKVNTEEGIHGQPTETADTETELNPTESTNQKPQGVESVREEILSSIRDDVDAIRRVVDHSEDAEEEVPEESTTNPIYQLVSSGFERLAGLLESLTATVMTGLNPQAGQQGRTAVAAALDGIRTGGTAFMDLLSGYYKGLGSVGASAVHGTTKFLGGMFSGAIEGLFGKTRKKKNEVVDVYFKGAEEPVLRAELLKQGYYFDKETGRPIYRFEDIKGTVVDKDGQVKITEEDVKDERLEVRDGSGRLFSEIVGKGLGLAKGALGSIWGAQMNWVQSLWRAGKSTFSKITGYARKKLNIRDVYVKGETTPRLRAVLLKKGAYISVNSEKRIYSLDELDGPIEDIDGNRVLDTEDYQIGLVDQFGTPIESRSLLRFMANAAVTGAKKVLGAGMAAGKMLWNVNKFVAGKIMEGSGYLLDKAGAGISKVTGFLGGRHGANIASEESRAILEKQLEIQTKIYESMRTGEYKAPEPSSEQAPNITSDYGSEIDSDDPKDLMNASEKAIQMEQLDVLRDIAGRDNETKERKGSWQEKLKKKEAEEARREAEGDQGAGEEERAGASAGPLGRLIGRLTDTLKTGIGSLGSLFGDGLSALGGFLAGKLGIESGAGLLKNAKNVGKVLGSGAATVGRTLLSGAGAIGTALTGTAGTAAVLSGAAIVGGVALAGYGGYKLYKHLFYGSDVEPIEGLRFIQYGANPEMEDFVYAIRHLEDLAFEDMEVSGNQVSFDGDVKDYFDEVAEDFGLAAADPEAFKRWNTWFAERFLPVAKTHMLAANAIDPDVDLDDIDDEMDDEKKHLFVLKVQVTDKDVSNGYNPYAVSVSPMGGIPVITDRNVEVAYVKRLLESFPPPEDVSIETAMELVPLAKGKNGPRMDDSLVDASKLTHTEKEIEKARQTLQKQTVERSVASVMTIGTLGVGKALHDWMYAVEPLEGIRLLHYGVPLADRYLVSAVRELEELVLDDIDLVNGKATLDESYDYYFEETASSFYRNPDDMMDKQIWMDWFKRRFLPVILFHLSILEEINSSADLDDVDDDLSTPEKQLYIKRSMDINKNREPEDRPLEVASKPMPGHTLVTNVELINRYIKLLLVKIKDEDAFDDVDPEAALTTLKETPEVKSPYTEQTQPELGAFKPEKGLIRSGVEAVRNVTFAIPILGSTLKGWFGEKEIQPIEGLRLLQYGASLEDATFVAALRDLEETVIDDVEWKGGVPTWDLDEFDDLYDDVRSDFGMLDDPQDYLIFKTWFIRRFLAVLMMHLMALYQLDEDMDLEDLDEDLETDKKRQFITAVDKSDFMEVTESPMRGHPILKNPYVIQAYVRKLLDTLNSTGDLDAFDEHFLPEAAVKDPKIRFQMEKNLEKAKQSASESRAVVSTEKVARKDYSKIADRVKQRINEYRKTSTKMDLIPPIEDGIISSEFGERTDPFGSKKSNHKGIDFAAPTGTPVMAAGDGVIARKGSSKSYGNVIYIRHPNRTYTRYAHLHSFAEDLEIGNKVKQGEVIGYVGSTGHSTGPHLHFEYRRGMYNDSEAMDPMPNFVASYRKTLEKQVAEATSEPETDGLEGVDTLGNQDTPKTRVGLVAKEASLEARQASEEYGGKTSIPVQDVASLATGLNQEAKSITPPKIEVVQDNTPIKDLINKQDVIANGAVSQREAMLQSQKEIIAQLAAVAAALKEKETVVVASNTGEPMPVKEKVKSDSRKESPWPRTRNTRGVLDLTS